MDTGAYSNREIAADASSRVKQVYWRLVVVFAIMTAISLIPSVIAAFPKRSINNEKYRALAEYDVSFAKETLMDTITDVPTLEEFVEIERNTKSGKNPEFFTNSLPGLSTTDFSSDRKQISAPYNKRVTTVDLISNIASFLLCVFVIGPVNAGFARTVLDFKDDGISYTPSDLTSGEVMEANSTSFILGLKDIFTFAFREKRYFRFVGAYFIFYGAVYIGMIFKNVQTILGLSYLQLPALALMIAGVWVAVYEFTFLDYILADKPETSPLKALNISIYLMKGNRSRILGLVFAFPLWVVILFVSCGVGVVFFAPVFRFAIGSLYEYLRYGRRNLGAEESFSGI